MSSTALYNVLLTLPDREGWHDRFLAWLTPRGAYVYVVHTCLGGRPLTWEALEVANGHAVKSLDPIAISARKETARRRQ